MEVILSLGSNLGNRLANLPGTALIARAPLYTTEPVDVPTPYQAAYYYNTVVILETALAPEECSREVHAIEERMGRQRDGRRHVPRLIDIDLIACGSARRHSATLYLPHPEAAKRRFVLQPLADLRPDLILPGQQLSVAALLAALPLAPAVSPAPECWQ